MAAFKDTRIPYGASCTWWDSIDKVGTKESAGGHKLPCCPHCRGMLFEMSTPEEWFEGVDRYDASGHPGYRAMIEWARGKCFPGLTALKAAYDARFSS